MENAETILVIMLSVFLAFFLFLGCFLLVKGIQIANRISRLVDKAESVTEFIEKAGSGFAASGLVSQLVRAVRGGKKGKG